ncbi:MAG TPA: cold shock domain-containing protein [Pseudonocardiaceae bacterium]
MGKGTVIKYDEARGYGFIAPDDGGEDLFMHIRDVVGTEDSVTVRTRVEFEVVDGARGLRATDVRAIGTAPAGRLSAAGAAPSLGRDRDDDDVVDVLSEAAYSRHITDVLINVAPTVNGGQIVEIRRMMIAFARKHGWVE